MSDYIERQKAVEALDGKIIVTGHKNADAVLQYMKDISDKIKALPSADVVQVCRCKDCKHFYFADNRIPQEQRYVCEISGEIWKPDSFCSYGERKE
jgi:predicted Zn-ribbon and HTH transcriptional regulator